MPGLSLCESPCREQICEWASVAEKELRIWARLPGGENWGRAAVGLKVGRLTPGLCQGGTGVFFEPGHAHNTAAEPAPGSCYSPAEVVLAPQFAAEIE